jgi:hypothetical protein
MEIQRLPTHHFIKTLFKLLLIDREEFIKIRLWLWSKDNDFDEPVMIGKFE